MRKQVIAERGAPPKRIYSPAIVASGTIAYISGQGPIDPETGEFQLGSFAGFIFTEQSGSKSDRNG